MDDDPGEAPDRYVEVAVNNAIARVLHEPKGNRNNTLNREAFAILGLCRDRREARKVFKTLRSAAIANGLGDDEVRRTLHSAWTARAREGDSNMLRRPS